MAVEHAMFKFEDLKVNSHYDRQTDRMTTKVLSSRPRIKCGETNNNRVYLSVLDPSSVIIASLPVVVELISSVTVSLVSIDPLLTGLSPPPPPPVCTCC